MKLHPSNLGYHSKYVHKNDETFQLFESFSDSLSVSTRQLDVISVAEFLSFFYMLADRTLVRDIQKTPWLAEISTGRNEWSYFSLKDEPILIKTEEEFAKVFLENLKHEIESYIGNSKHIGILLTGGMDSRVVAAVLKNLLASREDTSVTAVTWGAEDSRDVVYSRRICSKYNWTFKNINLSPQTLIKNIEITALLGCEFSPIHLHGMNEVANLQNVDLFLAGSYGDGMGRAEYSGKHLSQKKSIANSFSNRFFLLQSGQFRGSKIEIHKDLEKYRELFPRQKQYSNYEIEMQAHYMRRELNPCMNVVNRKVPLYQCFAAPEIYQVVLNTPLDFRNDKLYYNLLKILDPELLDIPWSRTGKPYLNSSKNVSEDKFRKSYHNYGEWIKEDISEYIESTIFQGSLEKLNLFSMKSIRNAIKLNKSFGTNNINRIDEILVWLCSLSLMVKNFDLQLDNSKKIAKKEEFLKSYLYSFLYLNLLKIR